MSVSDLYDDAVQVKCPVMFRELLMSCNSEKHLCVGMSFKNLSSCKFSQNVCTSLFFANYLFKLFKKCMSKHPYQYFVSRFQLFKILISRQKNATTTAEAQKQEFSTTVRVTEEGWFSINSVQSVDLMMSS